MRGLGRERFRLTAFHIHYTTLLLDHLFTEAHAGAKGANSIAKVVALQAPPNALHPCRNAGCHH